MEGSSIVVIGGGPGGMVAAAHFAAMGARVTVYERSTYEEQTSSQRGWPIALGDVAKTSIEEAGMSSDFGPSCKCSPRLIPS